MKRLVLERPEGWRHRPGQVAELALGPGTAGYFAIASAPSERELVFLVKLADDTTFPIGDAVIGVDVDVSGPFGAGFELPEDPDAELLFVGAGTALAALRAGVVEALVAHSPERVTLLCGVRRPNDLAFRDELAAWTERGVRVRVVVSRPDPDDGWSGHIGWVQRWLTDLIRPTTFVFLAGSDVLEDAVEAELAQAGVARDHVQRNFRSDYRVGPEQA